MARALGQGTTRAWGAQGASSCHPHPRVQGILPTGVPSAALAHFWGMCSRLQQGSLEALRQEMDAWYHRHRTFNEGGFNSLRLSPFRVSRCAVWNSVTHWLQRGCDSLQQLRICFELHRSCSYCNGSSIFISFHCSRVFVMNSLFIVIKFWNGFTYYIFSLLMRFVALLISS